MTDRDANDRPSGPANSDDAPYPYPSTPIVAGIIESNEEVGHVVTALAEAGVPTSDLTVAHGAADAEKMEGTGRTGYMNLINRFTEIVGLPNDEVALRNKYEAALKEGRFVVSVAAPSDARKALAARVLAEHGGSLVNYFDRYTFEVMRP